MYFNCFKSGHSKKNCKNNTRCSHYKGNHNTALCYHRQNRNSYNDGVQRNPTQLPQRDNKGSKTSQQNQIQHEDGESQENVHESNVEGKLSCLVEGNTSIILQTANAIATDTCENKISTVKILLDSGSQQTFILEGKESNLKPFREEPVDINTFMSNHKRTTKFKEYEIQKQPSRSVLRKRCSENMQHIYRRTSMAKCDFNKVTKQRVEY